MEERTCQRVFINEYEVSKAFNKALATGHRLEEFDLIVADDRCFSYGADYRKVKKVLGDEAMKKAFPIKIRVKIYFFSCGENCYTLSTAQKKRYCELKKPKIVQMLKDHDYKKAKKLLNKSKEMLDKVLDF